MNNNVKEYYLNEKGTSPYIILEKKDNIALLRRFVQNSSKDPSPYIVANGVKTSQDELIEWDFGNYFKNIADATARYIKLTEGQKEKRHVNLYSDEIENWPSYCEAIGVSPSCSSLKIIFDPKDVEAFDQNDNRMDDYKRKPINLINQSRGR